MKLKGIIKIFALVCLLLPGYLYSQKNTGTFNSSYWNTYADKIHLSGNDRAEFINAHKKANTPAPITFSPSTLTSPFSQNKFSQNNNILALPCVNPDFEQGNLNGWVPTSGFNPGFNITGCCPNGGGQQLVVSGPGLDPYGSFPIVLPGGNFSLRLGDNVNGGEADRIEQTFLVTPSNANFSYQYAVVLEDPNHPFVQQPSFQVVMLDSTGAQVPCTYFYVAAGQNIPGFFNSPTPGVIYKPWTTVMVDLSLYIGQNLTIQFTTFDCSLGGHFGYAYIDGVCQSFVGGGADTICAGSTGTFCAPNGLASYTWNGPGVTNFVGQCAQVTTVGIYTVQTTLFTGCVGPTFTYSLADQPAPLANAGSNVTVCANNSPVIPLSGSITGFTSTPTWISSGSGIFTSTSNITSTYTPSNADITAGSVTISLVTANNGFCPPDTSSLEILITPAPFVNAGADATVCASAYAPLNGTVSGVTSTGIWASSGTGTFSPSPTNLITNYIPSLADISNGFVTLTLTSTGNGNCLPVSDIKIVSFQNPPLVNAGANISVCANNNVVSLSGNIGGFPATPVWSSSGTGIFTSTNNLNTSYNPSPGDVSAGSLTITLTTANNGFCPPATSTLQVLITPAPSVYAGANQTICSSGNAALTGTVMGPTNTGIWSSPSGGTFNPIPTILSPTYSPSNLDILLGNVTLTLTSSNNGNCLAVSNTVNISIVKIATVNTGPPQVICDITNTIVLNGNITGGTSTGIWGNNGTGTLNPGPTAVNNNTYFSSPGDVLQGTIIFTLTSTNNGICPAVSDTMMFTIVSSAVVNAGTNQFICSSAGAFSLSGASNPPACFWLSNGTGTFSPNNATVNPVYNISPGDISAGFVTFTLSSANPGICPLVTDTVLMKIQTIASVNAGPPQSICSTTGNINLNGNVSGGSGTAVWATTGSGAFTPGVNFLNNTYNVTFADVTSAVVIFTLTSPAIGPCPSVQDSLMLTIYQPAIINAGANQALCSNVGTLSLSGSVVSLSNTIVWNGTGSGAYFPNNTNVNTNYSISIGDVNVGSIIFTLSSTNNGACPATTDTVKITIRRIAVVNAGPDITICSTTTIVILSGTLTGGTSTSIWNTTATGTFVPNNLSLNPAFKPSTLDVSNGGAYMYLSSTNNGVCPVIKDSLRLRIMKLPVIDLNKDTVICSSQNPLTLAPLVTGDFGVLQWSTSGSGEFLPSSQSNPVKYDITNDIPNVFVKLTLSAISGGPCGTISGAIDVTIHPTPVADFSPSTFTANIPNDPVTFTNKSIRATKYSWNFGDGSGTSAVSPIHDFKSVGFYDVMLIASNQYGCADTAIKKITVIGDIQFPNVFTPNQNGSNGGVYSKNDYSNDVFFPYATGVTEFDMKIFNRWGELIFESFDIAIGWDGYFNGKLCQQDGYVWKADVKFFDGRTYNKTGSVTLLR